MESKSLVLLFQVRAERILRVSSSVLLRADIQSSGSNSLAPYCKEIQLLHTSQINREREKENKRKIERFLEDLMSHMCQVD